MIPHILGIVTTFAALGALASVAYYALCMWSALAFLRQREAGSQEHASESLPPVSILKPLKGTDPQMYESFRSHCMQDYPQYEIIFGVSEADDPAIPLVERLKAEFPERAIRLVFCGKSLGANTKVSNLAQILPETRYEHLIVNDSDIRVEPDYLRSVVAPLASPKIGLVTCLYRGVAARTFASRLESLSISTDFCAGVLVARQIEGGVRFGLGSTLAFRRRELAAVGGFEGIADYLADDYEIGRRIRELGREVKLSSTVVETFLPAYSLRQAFQHQLRWARTIRASRRWGYAGLVVTFGIPWALLAVICSWGSAWVWLLLGVVVVMRAGASLVVGQKALGDRQVAHWLWLIPVRDFLGLSVWLAGLAGRRIVWRGDWFELRKGKLKRAGE